MSFAAPLVLLFLLLVPVAVARYVAGERERRRQAGTFASARMLGAVAPVRPGWRRHLPLALYALALAVLIVAAAKPRATVAVPVENAAIMLVTDVSGSMLATDVKPSRLVAARRAAQHFAKGVPHGVRIGVMAFNQAPRTLQAPTSDRGEISDALNQLASSGGTATGDALDSALTALADEKPAAIVLLSDGASKVGQDPAEVAQKARAAKIPIYTVALGTPDGTVDAGGQLLSVPPDPEALKQVADISGGKAFTAEDSDALDEVYKTLGSRIGTRKEKKEVSAGFAAIGLLMLGGAAFTTLRWRGRLV
jgi:Ca-activated chloride channel family protein